MSTTGTQIFNNSIALLDAISDSGAILDDDVASYKHRASYLLDLWQKEMTKSGDLYKTFEISCFRKKNLLTDVTQFTIIEHTDEDQNYQANGALCFYFEIDGDARVSINDMSGNPVSGTYTFNGVTQAFNGVLDLTVPAGTTSFIPCKGMFDTRQDVVMTFSGNYYYRHNNRALCPNRYASTGKVPDFKPWYKIVMPDDFKSRSQIITEYPAWQYADGSSSIKWEGNKDLYVMFSYEGVIRVVYVPVPAPITALTQTIEVDDITAVSGAYYLATHFAAGDMETEKVALLKQRYNELKKESLIKVPLTPSEIIDVYGMGE